METISKEGIRVLEQSQLRVTKLSAGGRELSHSQRLQKLELNGSGQGALPEVFKILNGLSRSTKHRRHRFESGKNFLISGYELTTGNRRVEIRTRRPYFVTQVAKGWICNQAKVCEQTHWRISKKVKVWGGALDGRDKKWHRALDFQVLFLFRVVSLNCLNYFREGVTENYAALSPNSLLRRTEGNWTSPTA